MTTVLTAARIRCLDSQARTVGALAMRDGRILAIGDREAVLREAGDGAVVIDAGDADVLPGFIDAHHHVSVMSLYSGAAALGPPRVRDVASFQSALADAARGLAPGRWLVATGWDESQLSERRPPTVQELDEAVPDRPLFALHYTCHRALANSRALELAGIGAGTPDPSGGVISRSKSGAPDGLLIERGMSRVEALARPDRVGHDGAGILERMAAHYHAMVRAGITRVVDTAVPQELMTVYRESARRGEVLIPTHACPVSTTGYLEEPWDVLDGPPTGEVHGPLTVGPVKLIFDGAPGCSMCLGWWQAMASSVRAVALSLRMGSFDPVRTSLSVEPRFGRQVRSGIAIYGHEDAKRMIRGVVERGFSVATHAIGNAAIDVALAAYEATGSRLHDAGTARVEHASFTDRALAARMAALGVAAVVQPAMLAMHTYASAPSIPGLPFFGLRWLHDAGVRVVGSSDHPVDTFEPLAGIRAAVTRFNGRGVVVDAEQRLTLDEALAMYTRTAALVVGCLDQTGTLEVGKRADLVVVDGLSGDLSDARVRATWVGGEELHGPSAA